MKTLKHLLFLCSLAVLTACSDDAFVPQSEVVPTAEGGSVDYISMTVPDIEIDDATTRSKLVDDGTDLKFVWQEKDAIGVVPMNGLPLKFPIHAENAQKNTAVFDGGDWALKTDTKYAAFFPIGAKNQDTDIRHIAIDYTGQTQANWMKYDFLATGAVQPKDGAVKFTMKRLSAILKINVEFGSNNINTVRYATLVAPEPLFGVKGTLDLSGSEPVYTPEGRTKFINTDIGVEKSFSSSSEKIVFTFYFMIPPTNLSGKQLRLILNSDSGTAKEATFNGQNYEAGKAYSIMTGGWDARIRNSNLITAAGLSDIAGSNDINAWTYREQILQVKKIDVSDLNDPTVCDEIGFFRNLEDLRCAGNKITDLDLSNNPKLTYLSCIKNQLTSLDVSNCPALGSLLCYTNQLTSLDVSNCPALVNLLCSSNQLTSLDVSNCPALADLSCGSNQLTSLDVSNCTALADLQCHYNNLTSLDVSNCPALTYLNCCSNQLTSLDVSNNTALTDLYCYYNNLTSLDVSKCPLITWPNLGCGAQLDASGNYQYINVSGNDAMMEYYFEEGTIYAPTNYNYYVTYEGVNYP